MASKNNHPSYEKWAKLKEELFVVQNELNRNNLEMEEYSNRLYDLEFSLMTADALLFSEEQKVGYANDSCVKNAQKIVSILRETRATLIDDEEERCCELEDNIANLEDIIFELKKNISKLEEEFPELRNALPF